MASGPLGWAGPGCDFFAIAGWMGEMGGVTGRVRVGTRMAEGRWSGSGWRTRGLRLTFPSVLLLSS